MKHILKSVKSISTCVSILIFLTTLLIPVHGFALSLTMQARVSSTEPGPLAEAYWGTPVNAGDEFELQIVLDAYGSDTAPEVWDTHYVSTQGLTGALTVTNGSTSRVHALTEYRLLDNEPILGNDYLFIHSDPLMGAAWSFYFRDDDGSVFDNPLPFDSLGLNGWEAAFVNFLNPVNNSVIYQSEILSIRMDTAPVPEPSTVMLLSFGLLGLLRFVRHNRRWK
jgi:hypothetical protein